jgi:hypothetical protein
LVITFTDELGKVTEMETKIEERHKAKEIYDDAGA